MSKSYENECYLYNKRKKEKRDSFFFAIEYYFLIIHIDLVYLSGKSHLNSIMSGKYIFIRRVIISSLLFYVLFFFYVSRQIYMGAMR